MKTQNDHIVICRVAYCEDCYKHYRPSKEDHFVTIGRTHQKYSVRRVTLNGKRGFTPHIMQIQKISKDTVTYTSYCGIHECGCDLTWQEKTEKYLITPTNWHVYTVSLKEWNAMLLYKDDEDYFLD